LDAETQQAQQRRNTERDAEPQRRRDYARDAEAQRHRGTETQRHIHRHAKDAGCMACAVTAVETREVAGEEDRVSN
jgi:hypothetical protein